MLITTLFLMLCCSVLNRARGSRVFNHTNSTIVGRLISMGGITLLSVNMVENGVLFILVFGGLMLWASLAWDRYWSAMIGNEPTHSKGWGILMMTWRMAMLCPVFIAEAWFTGHMDTVYFSALPLLFALPYYFWGAVYKSMSVEYSEYTIGALIGLTTALVQGAW